MMYFQLLFLNGKSSSTNQLSVCVNHPKTLFTPTFSYEEEIPIRNYLLLDKLGMAWYVYKEETSFLISFNFPHFTARQTALIFVICSR